MRSAIFYCMYLTLLPLILGEVGSSLVVPIHKKYLLNKWNKKSITIDCKVASSGTIMLAFVTKINSTLNT